MSPLGEILLAHPDAGLFLARQKEATRMAISPRLLSVGNDPVLMSSRTLILRGAGYLVEEAYTVDKAVSLEEADSIDATIICHTISKDDQQVLVAIVREKRRLMPVLCIRAFPYQTAPQTCTAIDNQPTELLNAVRAATQPPKTDSLGPAR
jgi:DNA-binding NtrC family response regulator